MTRESAALGPAVEALLMLQKDICENDVTADSSSDEEGLLHQFDKDDGSDYQIPVESDDDEDEYYDPTEFDPDHRIPIESDFDDDIVDEDYNPPASLRSTSSSHRAKPSESTSSTTQPQPSTCASPSAPQRGRRTHWSSVTLPRVRSSSSESEESQVKKKRRSDPLKRDQGESAAVSDVEEKWKNKEDKDQLPTPLKFSPARPPGPTLDTQTSWSPLSLFQLFFSRSVVRTIIENTNANAARILEGGKKFKWIPLTVKDFYIFLAIIIFSGLVSVHNRTDYWKKKWPYNFPFPSEKMARERFEAILSSLHLSNPKDDEENEKKKSTGGHDRLLKIKPLYNEIVAACQAHFQPYRNISIDERMLASKAKNSMRMYKTTKWGYKLFVLADSTTGYTWNFFVYTGEGKSHTRNRVIYTSVMELLPFSVLGGGYNLYVDHFYSSCDLFRDLREKRIGCCGTMKKNRTGFPSTVENDFPKKPERGDIRWLRKDNLLFVKWMDSREVTMCSTIHEAFTGQTINRNVKEAGVWHSKVIPVPDAILDYNKYVGGVDLSDTLIKYYTVRHKSIKWYKTFFYHFVDIVVVNSFILHKELFKVKNDPSMPKPLTHKMFRDQLVSEMVAFAEGAESLPPPQPLTTCMPVYYGRDASILRKHCRRCRDAGIRRVKTPIYCRQCQVPLCLTSKKNCFQMWHDNL